MSELFQYKKIIYIAIVIGALFVVYNVFFKPEINSPLVTTDAASPAGELAVDKEILTLLGDLHSLVLDDSIFKNKAFRSLQDFSIPIEDEPKGRTNPFAPIGINATTSRQTAGSGSQGAPSGAGTFPEDFLEEDIVF